MSRAKQAKRDAKELFRLCLVDGLLDEGRVREVVRRVAESKNRNRLKFLWHFRRLVKLDQAQHTATVENATPLSADMQASIQSGLSHTCGPFTWNRHAPRHHTPQRCRRFSLTSLGGNKWSARSHMSIIS